MCHDLTVEQVVEYITYQFVAQYDTNSTVKSILDKYDFYILPFVNPDGMSFPGKPTHAQFVTDVNFPRLCLLSDQRPPLAQEPPVTQRPVLRRNGSESELALQVGTHRRRLHVGLR